MRGGGSGGRTGRVGWRRRISALVPAVALLAAGCQTESTVLQPHNPAPLVVVAVPDLAELELLGYVYVNALTRAGFRVHMLPKSGTPTQALDDVVDGTATLTLGYTGDLLTRFDPSSRVTSAKDVYTAMSAALPEGTAAADPSAADDAPAYVVTRHTAETMGLRRLSDLRGRCGELVLGARPEVLDDKVLSQAVGTTYDCSFGRRDPQPPNPRDVQGALRAGRIGVGVVQSTDPLLRDDDMVALADDAEIVRDQRIVPVFRKGSLTEDQRTVVDGISGELTTDDVRELLLGSEFHTAPSVSLALYWLDKHGR